MPHGINAPRMKAPGTKPVYLQKLTSFCRQLGFIKEVKIIGKTKYAEELTMFGVAYAPHIKTEVKIED